ncbi:TPA: phage tail protein [Serratia marcescens]
MADDGLKEPVIIQATRIDATLLPRNIFSQPYLLYVIQQGADLGNVAGKANEAGHGAWDAQQKNDEQDLVLANHESRITAAEVTLVNHEQRITSAEATLVNHETRITQNTTDIAGLTVRMVTAESNITSLQTNVASLTTRVTTAEGNITTLQGKVSTIETNYVSKAVSTSQSVQATGGSFLVGNVATPTMDKLQVGGSINISGSYKVAGLPVLGARQTGWTAATGTANKGAFNADQLFTVGATYTQAEVQALADALKVACQRVKALEDMARAHGLIN